MSDILMSREGTDLVAWRQGMTDVYRAGETMIESGLRPRVELTEAADTLTIRQLRFVHGPILQQISEQVFVNGRAFAREVWKEHLKDLFIPDQFEMVQAPFIRDAKTGQWRPSKRKVPQKKRKSLTSLTGRKRSEFIDQVLAHAATEWGVTFVFRFDERESVRWQPPQRKVRQAAEREEVAA